MINKIELDMDWDKLKRNMEKYKEKALELGASRAGIVSAAEIPVDDRVIMKCQVPRCFGFGMGANCPPYTMKPAELRDLLKGYQMAVLFTLDITPEVVVRSKATIKERVEAYQLVFRIVSQLESAAFYDGYYLAFGLGAGSCRHTFCGLAESCQALEGKKCRHSLVARPSMEAVGIDVFKMVVQEGWEIYPIGSGAQAEQVPKGTLAGIVVVA